MSKNNQAKWYKQKKVYIPISILLGLVGFSSMVVTHTNRKTSTSEGIKIPQ